MFYFLLACSSWVSQVSLLLTGPQEPRLTKEPGGSSGTWSFWSLQQAAEESASDTTRTPLHFVTSSHIPLTTMSHLSPCNHKEARKCGLVCALDERGTEYVTMYWH